MSREQEFPITDEKSKQRALDTFELSLQQYKNKPPLEYQLYFGSKDQLLLKETTEKKGIGEALITTSRGLTVEIIKGKFTQHPTRKSPAKVQITSIHQSLEKLTKTTSITKSGVVTSPVEVWPIQNSELPHPKHNEESIKDMDKTQQSQCKIADEFAK